MSWRGGRAAPWIAVSLTLGLLPLAPTWALTLNVQVEGLSGPHAANVLAQLSIEHARSDSDLTAERITALHRRAPEQIRAALAPFGFYRVEIAAQLDRPASGAEVWRAHYRVTPGEPVRVASVDYQITGAGAANPVFPKTFPLTVGAVLNHADYEQAKSDIRYAASAAGYLDYQFAEHLVLVDLVSYEAHIVLHVITGPQYRFGAVRFEQDLLDESLLNRYVRFKPGDVYNPDALLGLQGRLLGSEYFSDVEIMPLKDEISVDNRVPIQVIAQRNRANKYRIGLGFATDVGPRLTLDYQRRYLNSYGDTLRTALSLSPTLSQWELDYRIPLRDPVRDYLIIKPISTYYDTATRLGWTHSLQIAHSSLTAGGWRRNIGLDYRYENVALYDHDSAITSELTPSLSWSKTVADDPVNTQRGYRIKYSVVGSLESVVSETSYLSAQLQFKGVRRFAQDYRIIARADLGATWAQNLSDLPAGRRFYAGGDSSLRGWDFDGLGPRDPVTQEIIGGRYLAVGSLELERRLSGQWSAAIFTDFGNAFDPDYEHSIAQSVGFGVRWASPIGPVRCDLAFGVSESNADGSPPARLHIVIGPDL
ncbi:translocation and assembly module TamA [Allochromatium warmingii]|uniref:Translocation and assembly module subunit TamA n=1 Tax=Allochromatium warmingii TaxID=61595 RepID=A0A1H3JGR5_ALLWA|nr:autotransporter assembly complex family protein [Allochromatium warmingii]SDY39102.1 translocation and assembly module TamA [Allochromatium warmingii]